MQKYIPFIGPSYVYRSVPYDAQRSINLIPSKSEIGDSRTPTLFIGSPGISLFAAVGTGPIRCTWNVNGRLFVVSGNTLYEVSSTGVATSRGTLSTSTGIADISDNGVQLCIVDGAYGYILQLTTNIFSNITSVGWVGSNSVDFIDGYFVFVKPDSGQYYISAQYDGTTIAPLDFATAEGSPDGLVTAVVIHQNIWLFGNKTIEMHYDSGAAAFPFEPIQGAFIEYGCGAISSVAKAANSIFWLYSGYDGDSIIFEANGYQPKRISTDAIEAKIRGLGSISSAKGYTYQEDGHFYYVLNIDGLDTTLVYDITMQQWHERAYFDPATSRYMRQRQDNHVFVFGKHLMGDYINGNLYEQSLDIYSDNGDLIRRERTSPHIINNLNQVVYNSFQLDMEVGIGLDGAPATEDIEPMVMLQCSNDGGKTYGNERQASAGAIGQTRKRVRWTQLGRSRDRIHKLSISSRAKIAIYGATIDAEALRD